MWCTFVLVLPSCGLRWCLTLVLRVYLPGKVLKKLAVSGTRNCILYTVHVITIRYHVLYGTVVINNGVYTVT
uniref:Uncharacterized protein n=1 Tax=Otarine gammaherpesvirus 4 TaxID=2801541 RepID=A0A889IW68_9GAMA|nr:hypothetical protein [Otarine gammaherpesvirus 4]